MEEFFAFIQDLVQKIYDAILRIVNMANGKGNEE